MKKLILLIFMFVSGISVVLAQDEENKADGGRLQAFKIAFLTKRLNLSVEEAQKFWPIYNKYEQELKQARAENRQNSGDVIEIEEKILNIRKKYNGEFTKAISGEKINLLFKSEKEFGAAVQKELLERRQQNLNRRRN